MRSFHDLPLVKACSSLLARVTAGAAVAASIWLGATETEGRLAEVANNALPTAAASAQLLNAVDTIQVTAMRAMVWQQAGVPETAVEGLVKDVGSALTALRASSQDMIARRAGNNPDPPRLKVRIAAGRSAQHAQQLGHALTCLEIQRSRWAISAAAMRRSRRLRGDISGSAAEHRSAEAASVQVARDSSHAMLIRAYWIVGGAGLVRR